MSEQNLDYSKYGEEFFKGLATNIQRLVETHPGITLDKSKEGLKTFLKDGCD